MGKQEQSIVNNKGILGLKMLGTRRSAADDDAIVHGRHEFSHRLIANHTFRSPPRPRPRPRSKSQVTR
jgi:hypothetical protein